MTRPSLRSARGLFRLAALLVPLGVAGNVALTLLTTDRHILEATATLPLGPLAVALALALVPWAMNTFRLQLWASFVGHPIGFVDGLRIYLGGLLGSAVTPTASGGGALKWALLARQGVPAGAAGTLLLVEAVENAVFMAVALPLALVVTAASEVPGLREAVVTAAGGVAPVVLSAAAVLGALGTLAWVAARGVLGRGARRLVARVRARARRPVRDARRVGALVATHGKGRLALGVTLAGIQWTARYSVATALLAFLGVPISAVLSWALQWATFTLMNAIPTPGAAGGAEAVFAVLYSPFVPTEVLGLATAGWRLILFYAPLAIAALVYLGIGTPDAMQETSEAA